MSKIAPSVIYSLNIAHCPMAAGKLSGKCQGTNGTRQSFLLKPGTQISVLSDGWQVPDV
ncbi:hypothetical protein GCM10009413_04960 [Tatumella punctata]